MDIRLIEFDQTPAYDAHIARHLLESVQSASPFMPYHSDLTDAPLTLNVEALALPVSTPGWMRCWVVWSDSGRIVGHADLRSMHLKSALHRCELGMGLEASYRKIGLGRAVLDTAIKFARENEQLNWLDLRVFSHNDDARRLYERRGFIEIGVTKDCFRLGARSIDDVSMTLNVAD